MKAAIPATEFVCAHAQTLMSLRTQTAKLPLGAVTRTEANANANANANILSTTLDRLVWTLCVSGYAHPALGKENHGEGKIEVKEGTLRGKSIAERSYYLCWILFLCFYDGDAIDLISLTVRTCRF